MMQKARNFFCRDENAKLFVSCIEFCLFQYRDMIWWVESFGSWRKYVHELSVEDVLKPKVCHRPDIREEGKVTNFIKSSNQKNLGLINTEPQYL